MDGQKDRLQLTIGVDASSLAGGGRTHLVGVLRGARPGDFGISRIRVWAPCDLLDQLPAEPWLEGISVPEIEGPRWRRLLWQRFGLPKALKGCDLFWSPGAFVPFRFEPSVLMNQNSLIFDLAEQRRYGISVIGLRLRALRRSQTRSLGQAAGIIFLTEWGERLVRGSVDVRGATAVIPHGIDERFLAEPRLQEPIAAYSDTRPLRLVYVSIVDVYKHQWHVARAVAQLRRAGIPVDMTFVGPAYPPALKRLEQTLDELDPDRHFLHYRGPVPYDELPAVYRETDLCVFASTCENLPNILLEAMGCAMPIACSDRSPMREVVQDAGVLFDAESPGSIAAAIEKLATDAELRSRCATRARALASAYSWRKCSDDTLRFLAGVARRQRSAPGDPHPTGS